MVAWKFDDEDWQQADLTKEPFPEELREALLDPTVEKWAFNAAFERLITKLVLGIDTPYEGWRCTMALANMMSFSGTLLDVGMAMNIPQDKVKDKDGHRLIRIFCQPQKPTKNQPHVLRNAETDPFDWQKFLEYNLQDVIAENVIRDKLLRFYIPDREWELYELDQRINDRGLPVNRRFVEQGEILSDRRKIELTDMLSKLTGLNNPNSLPQIGAWLRQEGYPFPDLKKDTVTKVLGEDKAWTDKAKQLIEGGTDKNDPEIRRLLSFRRMTAKGRRALRLRQQASRTSVRKYPAMLRRMDDADDRMRHTFQFAGAPRTIRWSGRGPQPHNFTRTPKSLEAENGDAGMLELLALKIEEGDYEALNFFTDDPMSALAASIRSSIQAPEGYELRVCDLSAIESAVIAWFSGCERMLQVFHDGLDPYRDFGTVLYGKPYSEITGTERTICKPAVLGCGYQLSGGMLRDGQRTGLWKYAESNGVDLTKEQAHQHVKLFRETYWEIPRLWRELENAASDALKGYPTTVRGLLHFRVWGPFLTVTLPSGRMMYYYKPLMIDRTFEREDGSTYTRRVMSYMGKTQGNRWTRLFTSGGKWAENVTQAFAREILSEGMLQAHEVGFNLIGHVHDELIALQRIGDNFFTGELLAACMTSEPAYAHGLPLGAKHYAARVYRKD